MKKIFFFMKFHDSFLIFLVIFREEIYPQSIARDACIHCVRVFSQFQVFKVMTGMCFSIQEQCFHSTKLRARGVYDCEEVQPAGTVSEEHIGSQSPN